MHHNMTENIIKYAHKYALKTAKIIRKQQKN